MVLKDERNNPVAATKPKKIDRGTPPVSDNSKRETEDVSKDDTEKKLGAQRGNV